MLVANIDVKTAGFSAPVTVCIPLQALESFLQEKRSMITRVGQHEAQNRAAVRADVEAAIRRARVMVAARFPTFGLPARSLVGLSAGQVIETGLPLDVPAEVLVSGRVRFLGNAGQVRRNAGVRILQSAQGERSGATTRVRARILMNYPNSDQNSDPAFDQIDVAPLAELGASAGNGGVQTLDALLDVNLPVTIEFGRTAMVVQEVLGLGPGSVIQLSRMVGEPVDVYVADRKFAEGEVVVVGEHFGVRIIRILPASDQQA